MAGLTLEDAEDILAALIAAQIELAGSGQSAVEILGKKVTFVNLTTIQNSIDFWDQKCIELAARGSRTGRRVRGGTPSYSRDEAEEA